MGLRYVLLVATALLSLAAAAEVKPNASTDVLLGNSKRFVRAGWISGMDKDHDDEDDEEERMVNVHDAIDGGKVQKLVGLEKAPQGVVDFEKVALFTLDIREQMLKDEVFKARMFELWNQAKFSSKDIRDELELKEHPRYNELLLEYINKFISPKDEVPVFDRIRRIHFGENTVRELPPEPLTWKEKIRAFAEKLRCRDGCGTWPNTRNVIP